MMDFLNGFILITVLLSQTTNLEAKMTHHSAISKRSVTQPDKQCTKDNQGASVYAQVNQTSIVWICINASWTPFQLLQSVGQSKRFSAESCKNIKAAHEYIIKTNSLLDNCTPSFANGVYWIQNMQIYCDMMTDGGGWTLVWQHTYMKYNPLHSRMFYFSDYYQPCDKNSSYEEWCNVPNKARFKPTEQMIVAYHKGTMIYAYKGFFNRNIDYHWTGGILLDAKNIQDLCTRSINKGKVPSPSIHFTGIFGLTFDKYSTTNHYIDCDTYHQGTTLTNPKDCRWYNCYLPNSISSKSRGTDMTLAIYVR